MLNCTHIVKLRQSRPAVQLADPLVCVRAQPARAGLELSALGIANAWRTASLPSTSARVDLPRYWSIKRRRPIPSRDGRRDMELGPDRMRRPGGVGGVLGSGAGLECERR